MKFIIHFHMLLTSKNNQNDFVMKKKNIVRTKLYYLMVVLKTI